MKRSEASLIAMPRHPQGVSLHFGIPHSLHHPSLRIFLCWFLFLGFLLAACGDTGLPSTATGPIDTPSANTQPNTTPAIMATGNFHEYPLPQSDSQMMRPAIDRHGRIWFGEMGRNYLAVFDPRTQSFQQI